jgi:hypothetical protein
MTLSPEQQKAVAAWVAEGDNLSVVQKKLIEQFKLPLTYMQVRFLVDDLELKLRDRAPKADSDLGAARQEPQGGPAPHAGKKGFLEKAREKLGLGQDEPEPEPGVKAGAEEDGPAGAGGVSVAVDKVTLLPGALASGTVTFSDGVSGKWIVDNQGRPGLTEISRPGYRPTPADAQEFMQQLGMALQNRGY